MDEKQIKALMQSLDNDLMEKEMDHLMGGIEMDMASISRKAHSKLKREQKKHGLKRKWAILAASLSIVVGTSTVYAAEISDFIQSFLSKVGIYSTVVEGPSYYLESPVKLDNGGELRKAFFTKDGLELVLFFPDKKKPADLTVSADGIVRIPDGLSGGAEGIELSFSDMETCENFELTIDGKQYLIALTAGKSVTSGGDIIPAEPNSIDWVNMGYKRTEKGIQVLTSFADKNIQLKAIGQRSDNEKESFTTHEDGRMSFHVTSKPPKPLTGTDTDGNVYEFATDSNDTGRPLTMFYSSAPAGKEIRVSVPSITVGYEKDYAKLKIAIPAAGEKLVLNKEVDFGLQKMVLQGIERTSTSTVQLIFALNTGDKKAVSIRSADIYCEDAKSGELLWTNDTCTMDIVLGEDLSETEFTIGWPTFVVNGDWTLVVK